MASDRVTVRGANEVRRTLRALAGDIKDLDTLAIDGAALVQRKAQGLARRKSGAMRGSITTRTTRTGAQVTAGEGLGVYPMVQEYGSRRLGITANRYMQQARDSQEPPVQRLFAREVKRAADQVRGA